MDDRSLLRVSLLMCAMSNNNASCRNDDIVNMRVDSAFNTCASDRP